tara:strand:- start:2177 stop:2302 length:126 start_codon:yes stop_codon:yes gene_type:complete
MVRWKTTKLIGVIYAISYRTWNEKEEEEKEKKEKKIVYGKS